MPLEPQHQHHHHQHHYDDDDDGDDRAPSTSGPANHAPAGRGRGRAAPGRGRGRGRHAVPPPARQPGLRYEKEVVPLAREAERDLLPDGHPNTPYRRLAYQLRQAATVQELQALMRAHRDDTNVWGPHHTALTVHRLSALLYPRAVAAGAADADDPELTDARATANGMSSSSSSSSSRSRTSSTSGSNGRSSSGGLNANQQQRIDPALKAAANSMLNSLSTRLTKPAVRQVQGFHLARLLICMTWLHLAWGPQAEAVIAVCVRELLRPRGDKLARVAAADPVLFGRLVRALAVLMPRHAPLWVEVQRLTLASLLAARSERQGGERQGAGGWDGSAGGGSGGGSSGGSGAVRLWGPSSDGSTGKGPSSAAASAAAAAEPLPDASAADLINVAFGLAASGHVLPPVFDALREALLAQPLAGAAGPEALASLVWAWARAQQPPGMLSRRALEAFEPLLEAAPARPLGRLLWAMGVLGLRNQAFLAAAAAAITRRQLVFASPQELVNVTWAFSQLGFRVVPGGWGPGGAGDAAGAGEAATGPGAGSGRRRGPQRGPRAGQEEESEDGVEDEEGQGQAEEEEVRHGSGRRGGRRGAGVATSLAAARAAVESAGFDEDESASASAAAAAAAAEQLRPLPLAAVQDSVAARTAARAAAPPPEHGTPAALYRWLAHCYLHSFTGSASKWTMSDSQLAALAAAFAAAGYANRPLFYTMGRMAMRRLPTLTPADFTQLIGAFARVRLRHDALLERACELAEARSRDFTPQQQAQVLWVVQALLPRARFAALAAAFRQQRQEGQQWQQRQEGQQQRRPWQAREEQGGDDDGDGSAWGGVVAVEAGGRFAVAAAPPPGGGGPRPGDPLRQQRHRRAAARRGVERVPVPLLPLDVPAHLLADADWESDLEDDDDEFDFENSESNNRSYGSDYDGSGGGVDLGGEQGAAGGRARASAVDGTMWGGRRRNSMRSVDELEEWGAAAQ